MGLFDGGGFSDIAQPAAVGNLFGGITGGVAGGGLGWMEHKAKGAANDFAQGEQMRLQQQQAQRDANIAKLREIFGIGSTHAAQNNKMSMDDMLKNYYNSLSQNGLNQADTRFADLSRTNKQNLARMGNTGGGLEASTKAKTLSQYLQDRQNALSQAGNARNALSNSLVSQRQGLEGQLSSGTVANPDFSSIIANRDNTLRSANANVIPSAIGDVLNAAGSTFGAGAKQSAYGNQGLSIFNTKSGGNIT